MSREWNCSRTAASRRCKCLLEPRRGAGDATGPNVVFAFDRDARPPRIIIRADKADVAGSRIAVRVDSADTPAFSHIFTTTECTFDDGGSKCELTIPRSSRSFSAIITWFKRARQARVTVEDAGVMKMDQTVSLIGFRARFRQSNRGLAPLDAAAPDRRPQHAAH
jgi:hypothetical protein